MESKENYPSRVVKRLLLLAILLWASSRTFANNPCIFDAYTADPTPLWVNNTMYLYCSHDANFVSGQNGYDIPNDVLISSTDLVNWEDEGEIVTSGVGNPWAPAVVYANGTYYLYYTAGGGAVGVLTSTSPNGPFAGGNTSLVNGGTSDPGMGGNLLDPAAFVDTTGQAYLYFGGGGPGTGPGNDSRVIKLNANMISVNGSGSGVPAPNFFEASGINVRNGVYYYSYSSDPANGMNIEYIMANNPMFTGATVPAQPIIVANGGAGNCYNNQGGGLVNIGTNWYAAYFNRSLAFANGLACSEGVYQRSVCFDQMNFNSDGTIQEVTQTTTGPTALHNVNAFVSQRAASMADEGGVAPSGLSEKGIQTEACSEGDRDVTDIESTDWTEVRNVDFATCASAFTARVAASAAGGVIQIHLDSQTGTLIGTCNVPATGGTQTWSNVSCPVTGASGIHNIYFVFSGTTFNFESYSFSTCGSPTVSPTRTGTPSASPSPTPSPTSTRTPSPIPTPGPCQYVAAVDSGATAAYTSNLLGLTFGADQQYVPGSAPGATGSFGYVSWAAGTAYTSTTTITGGDSVDATLYDTQRYGATLGYDFSVPNGPAYVTFYWAETYATAPAQRVFSVTINGTTVEGALDLYSVGGPNATYIVTFPVTVTGGLISIVATASVNNAEFQGISVQAGSGCTPTPSVTRTGTASPTASLTDTTTASPTPTRTGTNTPTTSSTLTPMPSYTHSPMDTVTLTSTGKPSFTVSPMDTATSTATVTPSFTVSPVDTATSTATVTPSFTISPVDTATSTSTVTPSSTASPVDTATSTATATPSFTASPKDTATLILTPSPTLTATPSFTASPTATTTAPTQAAAGIVAPNPLNGSSTGGFAVSVSVTGMSSNTLFVDYLGTTITATLPASVGSAGAGVTLLSVTLPILSSSAAAGATGVVVYVVPSSGGAKLKAGTISLKSPTLTPSPTEGGGPLQIFGVFGVPNPNPTQLAVDLAGPADEVEFKVFTKGLTVVVDFGSGPLLGGWNKVLLPSTWSRLPNGLYYILTQARRAGTVSASRFTKVMILR